MPANPPDVEKLTDTESHSVRCMVGNPRINSKVRMLIRRSTFSSDLILYG